MLFFDNALQELRWAWYGLGLPSVYLHSYLVGMPPGTFTFSCEKDLEEFLQENFLFLSYRRDFPPLLSTTGPVCSDAGWGCLVRATQMLMAHCLLRHKLHPTPLELFRDVEDTRTAPFSVRALVGHAFADRPFKPEYWSPSQGCRALHQAVEAAVSDGCLPRQISVVSGVCGTLFAHEVLSGLAGEGSVLLLLPVLISASTALDQVAFVDLSLLMQLPTCIGMVGGAQNRSFYLAGCNQQQILFLDPHLSVQPALVDPSQPGDVVPTLAHLKAIPFGNISSSLYMSFFVKTTEEWDALRQEINHVPFLNVDDSPRSHAQRQETRQSSASPPENPSDLSEEWLSV